MVERRLYFYVRHLEEHHHNNIYVRARIYLLTIITLVTSLGICLHGQKLSLGRGIILSPELIFTERLVS